MALLFLFSILYTLCLLVERSIVGLSTQDIDTLRTKKSRAARQALALAHAIRSNLAALLLARILLLICIGVWFVAGVYYQDAIQITLSGLAGATLLWWQLSLLFSFVFGSALLFWGIYRLEVKETRNASWWLQGLWWVPAFWRNIFRPFLLWEEPADQDDTTASNAQITVSASEKRELELLKSIVHFGEVTVKQVMQPRSKVVSVDFRSNFHELLQLVRQSEFSRLPVQDADLDNVTGILYVKDLLPYLDEDSGFEWQSLIRTDVLMVPESKRGSELLEEFKAQKMHMTIVVDEYGGIAGICTLEDILEEVIGDIRDEFDEESDIRYRKIDDFSYLFEGQTLINDVCRLAGLPQGTFDETRGASDTLAGLVLELRGDIPLTGAESEWKGFRFKVTKANKRRVEQVLLLLPKS